MRFTTYRSMALALLVLGLAGLSTHLGAARLPDWAEEVAENAPALGEGEETATLILLRDVRMRVKPDGKWLLRRRLAVQALTGLTDGLKYGGIDYQDNAKVRYSKGWHLAPGKRAKKSSRASTFDVTSDSSFLTDAKSRVIAIEGVRRGSLVFFEFEIEEEPYTLSRTEYFLEDGPILKARFEVETPPGWKVESGWLRHAGPSAEIRANVHTWEIRDLPNPRKERLGEGPLERAPILVLNFAPPSDGTVRPAVVPSWRSLSLWYEDLARGRAEVTTEIARMAEEVFEPGTDERIEHLRAGANFVRDSVRYVAKEVGIGGYQPYPAVETLRDRYGDCKGKSTLYQSLLSAAGIASYPVLVNLGFPKTVHERVATPQSFNHMIVAIPLPGDVAVPEPLSYAVAPDDELGRLLFVDTTDEYTSFGSISSHLAGHYGLVVAGARGRLVKLPGAEPAAHQIVRRFNAEFHEDRTLSAELVSEYTGQPASTARAAYRKSSKDYRRKMERTLRRIWRDARILDTAIESETQHGRFVETVQFTIGPLSGSGPNAWVSLFPGAQQSLPRVSLSRRRTAVVYGYPRIVRYETNLRGVPESLAAPEGNEFDSEAASVRAEIQRNGDSVAAVWELELRQTRFEPETFDALREIWSATNSTARLVVDTSR